MGWGKLVCEGGSDCGGGGSIGLRSRGIRSEKKGTAYIRPPNRWRWPNVVVVDGTRYENVGSGEMVYESADGRVLNMTAELNGLKNP